MSTLLPAGSSTAARCETCSWWGFYPRWGKNLGEFVGGGVFGDRARVRYTGRFIGNMKLLPTTHGPSRVAAFLMASLWRTLDTFSMACLRTFVGKSSSPVEIVEFLRSMKDSKDTVLNLSKDCTP